MKLRISLADQELELLDDDGRSAPLPGFHRRQRPRRRSRQLPHTARPHIVRAKIGGDQPLNTVFRPPPDRRNLYPGT
jgi:hypothetical protein